MFLRDLGGGPGGRKQACCGVGDASVAAAGKDVEAEEAAAFGLSVVLLGEHGADQAEERVTVATAVTAGAAAPAAAAPTRGYAMA